MKLSVVALIATFSATASAGTLWGSKQSTFGNPPPGPAVPGKSPLLYCSPPELNILEIEKIDLDPNPPLPGHKLTIKAVGTLKQQIDEGAYVNVEVKYGLIRLIKQTLDLCENAGQIDMKCPVEPGDIVITKEVDLPKQIPPGKYHVTADVYTADDEPITCLTADVFFKPGNH